MAVDNYSIINDTNYDGAHSYGQLAQWGPMANSDTGQPYSDWGNFARSVQVEGAFGSAGSISIEGSNDGVNWHVLLNAAGSAATLTAAGIINIQTNAANIRPHVTAGDGTTALTVTMLAYRHSR